VKLVSWNILHGQSIPPTFQSSSTLLKNLQLAAAALRSAGVQVLALQEVDHGQERSGKIEQVKALADELGAADWAFAPTVVGTPGERWRALSHRDNSLITSEMGAKGNNDWERDPHSELPQYGVGIISKIPVAAWHRLELGRSRVGLPLAIPAGGDEGARKKIQFIYVKDEPRVALAAELENGFTVVATHLSFFPIVNYYQLIKIRRWLKKFPGEHLIVGDLNLGWSLPVRGTRWRSLNERNTYPSWGAKIQFDYITAYSPHFGERRYRPMDLPPLGISDHLPIGVEID
jgi:endonuclease/exonuclease/phosphatase family metal-dependent hydrolase